MLTELRNWWCCWSNSVGTVIMCVITQKSGKKYRVRAILLSVKPEIDGDRTIL